MALETHMNARNVSSDFFSKKLSFRGIYQIKNFCETFIIIVFLLILES